MIPRKNLLFLCLSVHWCTGTVCNHVFLCVLSQDQVDTLTFQNQSLRDKAKRFEEALRRSTDEQIVVSK